jgi:hypothetical protein
MAPNLPSYIFAGGGEIVRRGEGAWGAVWDVSVQIRPPDAIPFPDSCGKK